MHQRKQYLLALAALGAAFIQLGFMEKNCPSTGEKTESDTQKISTPIMFAEEDGAWCAERFLRLLMAESKEERSVSISAVDASTTSQHTPNVSSQTPTSQASASTAAFELDTTPPAIKLYQNSPNPFRAQNHDSATLIRFDWLATQPGPIDLVIYDIIGQRVRHLYSGEQMAGAHTIVWDGKDDTGQIVAAGKYWYRIKTAKRIFSKMLIVVR